MSDNVQLSYSSATLLKNCSQKYYWYKVAGVPKDPDSEDNQDAFNVGKCFHWVLEENGHTEERLLELLEEGVIEFQVGEHQAMIHAMLLRYLQVHQKSGLHAVKCELGLQTPDFIGFIDVILADPEDGAWWISDLKTSARLSPITISKLHNDPQLNLYSFFADKVAEQLELDFDKFMGARYRVTTKSRLTQKKSESYAAFVKRVAGSVKSYDVIVPKHTMNPEWAMHQHLELHNYAVDLKEERREPVKNLSYCDSFFRPCEFYSQCHGKTFTELSDGVEMLTSDNV